MIASDPSYAATLSGLEHKLLSMLDPEEVNLAALSDQARLIEKHGGREAVIGRGAANNTPVPGEEPIIIK